MGISQLLIFDKKSQYTTSNKAIKTKRLNGVKDGTTSGTAVLSEILV